MFIPFSSSMRYTEPKIEIYSRDRRSGAYPTKARTGDKTRTGRNRFYFDDTRTIMFATGTTISLPTTFHTGSSHLARDLTSSFAVVGNVKTSATDQWITHQDLSEVSGPFVEDKLFEQDQHAILNSKFMSGAAHAIAPDRFKMGVSSKTAIRITIPITQNTTLTPTSSSLYYFNPNSGTLDVVANERYSENNQTITPFNFLTSLTMFDPILFTPFGYVNVPVEYSPLTAQSSRFFQPSKALFAINDFVPDGNSTLDFHFKFLSSGRLATGSLINSQHRAHPTQSINLANYIPGPFLLEKAVIEFPFAAGPGWMNDAYVMEPFIEQATSTTVKRKKVDAGGPMITVALLRQDPTTPFHRDLIGSATFTNAFDALTASYKMTPIVYNDSGGNGTAGTQQIYARTGLSGTVDPGFVVKGPVMSGSTNFFTGAVRLSMTPAVTHHITRQRLSGTNRIGFFNQNVDSSTTQAARRDQALLMTIGAPTRRPGVFGSGRSVLGNNIAALPANGIDGTDVPISVYESDNENLPWTGAGGFERSKVYWDVISSTRESPYMLFPGDNLLLAFNKHRSTANSASFAVTSSFRPATLTMRAQHDAKIITGSMTITLYGDLIKEDREFHDTLNQRLETVELWETVGEEPVLDQFDVTYATELSSSYLDRNSIFQQVPYAIDLLNAIYVGGDLIPQSDTSFQFKNDVGHFASISSAAEQQNWNTLASSDGSIVWPNLRYAYELRKSNRNPVLTAFDELFWDTRIPNPPSVAEICNPQYVLATDLLSCLQINSFYSSDMSDIHAGPSMGSTTGGIRDWFMSYPYESRYTSAQYTFYSNLTKDLFHKSGPSPHGGYSKLQLLEYDDLSIELGDFSGTHSSCVRFLASEGYITNGKFGTGYVPLKKPEFIKFFFGIGDGIGTYDNGHVRARSDTGATADLRGWRYGMLNAFPMYSTAVFRRNRYGQFRDMLEQRPDTKYYVNNVLRESPVQVEFFDREGNLTDSTLTLSSNLSTEATSSFPYADGLARNRGPIDYTALNISSVVL